MLPRAVWLFCLTCLGCQAVLGTPTTRVDHDDRQALVRPPSGDADTAPGLLSSATIKPSRLVLAARSPANGDEERVCSSSRFVAAEAGQGMAGFDYAEMLFKQGHLEAARDQYQQTIARCQEEGERHELRRCHGKLLALAQAADDEYEVQLQRGISLMLLAQERARLGDPAGDVPVEGLLFHAAACLAKAHALRRDQARPCWYLHEVWRQLGQPRQAFRWLKQAEAAALFTPLTSPEQRGLMLAGSTTGNR